MKCVENVEEGTGYKTTIWETEKEVEHRLKMDLSGNKL